jgi:selenide, water dikinase
VPILAGALELGRKNLPGGGKTNEEHFSPRVRTETAIAPDLLALLYDPQTSGGLLAAIDPAAARAVIDGLESSGVRAVEIGAVRAETGPADGPLIVLS